MHIISERGYHRRDNVRKRRNTMEEVKSRWPTEPPSVKTCSDMQMCSLIRFTRFLRLFDTVQTPRSHTDYWFDNLSRSHEFMRHRVIPLEDYFNNNDTISLYRQVQMCGMVIRAIPLTRICLAPKLNYSSLSFIVIIFLSSPSSIKLLIDSRYAIRIKVIKS